MRKRGSRSGPESVPALDIQVAGVKRRKKLVSGNVSLLAGILGLMRWVRGIEHYFVELIESIDSDPIRYASGEGVRADVGVIRKIDGCATPTFASYRGHVLAGPSTNDQILLEVHLHN